MDFLKVAGVVLLVLWLVLWLALKITSGLIHILVLAGVVMIIAGFFKRT